LKKHIQACYRANNFHTIKFQHQREWAQSCSLFFYRVSQMVFAQIERLKKDSEELDIYAKKLEKKGQIKRAAKILKKREFVLETLEKQMSK